MGSRRSTRFTMCSARRLIPRLRARPRTMGRDRRDGFACVRRLAPLVQEDRGSAELHRRRAIRDSRARWRTRRCYEDERLSGRGRLRIERIFHGAVRPALSSHCLALPSQEGSSASSASACPAADGAGEGRAGHTQFLPELARQSRRQRSSSSVHMMGGQLDYLLGPEQADKVLTLLTCPDLRVRHADRRRRAAWRRSAMARQALHRRPPRRRMASASDRAARRRAWVRRRRLGAPTPAGVEPFAVRGVRRPRRRRRSRARSPRRLRRRARPGARAPRSTPTSGLPELARRPRRAVGGCGRSAARLDAASGLDGTGAAGGRGFRPEFGAVGESRFRRQPPGAQGRSRRAGRRRGEAVGAGEGACGNTVRVAFAYPLILLSSTTGHFEAVRGSQVQVSARPLPAARSGCRCSTRRRTSTSSTRRAHCSNTRPAGRCTTRWRRIASSTRVEVPGVLWRPRSRDAGARRRTTASQPSLPPGAAWSRARTTAADTFEAPEARALTVEASSSSRASSGKCGRGACGGAGFLDDGVAGWVRTSSPASRASARPTRRAQRASKRCKATLNAPARLTGFGDEHELHPLVQVQRIDQITSRCEHRRLSRVVEADGVSGLPPRRITVTVSFAA